MSPDEFKMPKTAKVLDLPYPDGRLICIGDIHGCLNEFIKLWEKLKPGKSDVVVFLGDLVDRGPASAETLEFVYYLCNQPDDLLARCYTTIGNHDEKAVRHRAHEKRRAADPKYRNPMKVAEARVAECAEMSDAALAWMAQNPHVIRFIYDNPLNRFATWCTHAGFLPWADPLRQPTSGLIRNRYVNPDSEQPATLNHGLKQPEGSVGWETLWDARARIVYGHNVHDLTTPRVVNNTYGIDTGCCFGGSLTALIDEGGFTRFEQVKAERNYSSDLSNDE